MPYLYYNISLRITIADRIQFNVAKSIEIESTIEKLSDTAKIELPREFKNAVEQSAGLSLKRKNLLEYLKVGDSIKIEAGYDDDLQTEFEGYITEIGAEIPTVLKCEDEMYKLRTGPEINKTFSQVTLKQLLKAIAPGYAVEAVDTNLGKMTITRAKAYKVLEQIKTDYGLRCYFKNKVLHAGMMVDFKPGEIFEFDFTKNIRQSSDLVYKTKDSRRMYIKATSMQKAGGKSVFKYKTVPGGTTKTGKQRKAKQKKIAGSNKTEVTLGDQQFSEITLHAPINLTEKELEVWVKKYYNSHVFDGYEGDIDGWAVPKTSVGDTAAVTDPNYADEHRDGQYFIEGVTTTIDESSGIKRQSKLSFKINPDNGSI